jgi:hypothetical protein
LHFFKPGGVDHELGWAGAIERILSKNDLVHAPATEGAPFVGSLPAACNTKKDARALSKALADWVYHNRRLNLLYNEGLGMCQRPSEESADFHARVELAGRERRDTAVDEASERFEEKIERLEDKRRTVARSIGEQEDKYSARKQEELLSLGATVLGMVFGRRRRLSGVATKRRMTATARARLESLAEKDQDLQRDLAELQRDAEDEARAITLQWENTIKDITTYTISPRRVDVQVVFAGVLWLPYSLDAEAGLEQPLYS